MALLTNPARRRLGTFCVLLLCCAQGVLHAQESLENDVKAAFLFNFTKFVEWPQTAFESPDDPLRVCVIADAAFTAAVDRILTGETVRGRPLRRVLPEEAELSRCHVLYIGAAEAARADRLIASLGRAPVLTVGETSAFVTTQGGAIGFVLENQRVRFDINVRAAERAGLTISSKLLRVAREIKEFGRP